MHHRKYLTLLRYPKSKRNDNFEHEVHNFKIDGGKKIIDIASCKCLNFNNCYCEKKSKVPMKERDFLIDQRSCSKMIIGNTNETEKDKLLKNIFKNRKTYGKGRKSKNPKYLI